MTESKVLYHWKYFLTLEKDFIRLKDYIEIHPDNFDTYSFELSKLLQLSCSEIDSVCRIFCSEIDPSKDYSDDSRHSGNIGFYKEIIVNKYPDIGSAEVIIPGLDNNILPWEQWSQGKSLEWWIDHNKVKHYRHSSFQKANLKNTLFSLSALMVIIMYLHRKVSGKKYSTPTPFPNFFDSGYFAPYLLCRPNKELPDFEITKEP